MGDSVGKLEEFENPSYEKTPPLIKKENEEFNWDIVEMEEIDLNDENVIEIVGKPEDLDLIQRQKSRSCTELGNV